MTEELSALLDGECSPAELDRLLGSLERDPNLKERFSRMCMARDSQRGTRWRRADLGFADRVMAALDREAGGSVVVPLHRRYARVWQPLAGLAAAATVAAVAVLAVRPASDTSAPPAVALAPADAPAPVQAADRRWNQLDAEYAKQLNNYMLTYSQSRARQGMGGTLGYARYAAYTSDARPTDSKR